jgi:hypothetical protein
LIGINRCLEVTVSRRRPLPAAALTVLFGAALALHAGTAGAASAAPGGFIDYQVGGKHQRHAISSFSLPSAYYTKSGDTEEFGLKTGSSNRMEHDTDNHYKSGRHEFQGDLQVFPGISQQSVVQIFGGGKGGPSLMIKVYGREGGSLVLTKNTADNLLTNAFKAGKIRVRLVHDVGAHKMTIYLNGAQKWTGADAGSGYSGGYNVKYGLYGSFSAPTHTVWSNVTLS